MTSTVVRAVMDGLPTTPGQAIGATTGGMVVVALVILLIARQLIEASGRPGGGRLVRTIDVAAIPFLVAFAILVYERLQDIMPLG